ncbi:uncharacterized protein LOC131156202 [Malania oleifera]|uniref:uncharacterized protein LOC131156202 n=1 Tax=Malania oleifera TaxID=397392 RepID=UPI0025AD9EDE|nr:uncharacterized protein LOC131156202 [Malania oleifera]
MADSEVKHSKKKKRKLRNPQEDKKRASKTPRADALEKEREPMKEAVQREEPNHELEEGRPWRNLQLILSIQDRDLDVQRKVELAYDFVNLRANEQSEDSNQGFETLSISRLVVFLNKWVQSLLISSAKKIRVGGDEPRSKVIGSCLDFRCWHIFKFCLGESLKWKVSLSFSRDLLRAICCIASNALSLINDASVHSKKSLFIGEGFELYSIALDCVSLVFSSCAGVLNPNLDLWILTVDAVVEAVCKIYDDNLGGGSSEAFVTRLSCLVLEAFAKFLRVHPCRKNGFRDFIDTLIPPLLHLLDVLHFQVDGNNSGQRRSLQNLVREVLSHGLFHPAHMDGFLSIRSMEKCVAPNDGKQKDTKTVIVSYHRHLFGRLEKIVAGKNVVALGGIRELFHVFVDVVKRQKGVSGLPEGSKMIGKDGGSRCLDDNTLPKMFNGNSDFVIQKRSHASYLKAETRKTIFDFFVKIMEPLLQEINSYVQAKLDVGPLLWDVHCIVRSTTKLLASFMHEKIYVRTEDTSEGTYLNFLKAGYDLIMSFSTKINEIWLLTFDADNGTHMETLNLIAKELIVAVRYFLEIEYEVVGNDLDRLWLMMLSYLVIDHSLVNARDRCMLTSEIVDLGCQLINLYGELRQVNITIFSLCKAVRLLVLRESNGEKNCSRYLSCTNSLSYEAYAKSMGMLLCSQQFRLAIYNAMKSVPEGQAGGCIHHLTMDISESLEWLKISCSVNTPAEFGELNVKNCNMPDFDLQAEILGRVLSEMYTLVLDSLTATPGNSHVIGISIEGLMTVLRPSLSHLVAQWPDGVDVNKFLFSITGRTPNSRVFGCKNDLQTFGQSMHWVFLFFFRLYMSSRSLYRQAISLVTPDASRKMSAIMGDSYTAYSGRDLMERTDCKDEGYFFWIAQPSVSLLTVIRSILDIYSQDGDPSCVPLIYVLHALALQRLVDLNRQIRSLEYLMQRNDQLVQIKLMDDTDVSLYSRKRKKWKRSISAFREEAASLTSFMMDYLPLVGKKKSSSLVCNGVVSNNVNTQNPCESDAWDLNICTVNEKSLPAAIWWIICHNIDVWCAHAAKKKLKMFLSLLISNSLPYLRSNFGVVGLQKFSAPVHLSNITICQVSYELLKDMVLYEQRLVRRYFASRFCRILEKIILEIFCDSSYGDVDFNSPPSWQKVLSTLDNSSAVFSGNKPFSHGCSLLEKPSSSSCNKLPEECCQEHKAPAVISMEIKTCQSLLSLLCWMPKGYSSSRSFSLYATYILNLERLVVGSLLGSPSALYLHHYELVRLFVSCRRALKYLIVASCEDKMEGSQSPVTQMLSEGPLPGLWLSKSVLAVVGIQNAFSEDSASQVKHLIFSLMDNTSYVFLTLNRAHSSLAVHHLMNAKKPCDEQLGFGTLHEKSCLIELDSCLDDSEGIDAWKTVVFLAKTLKEQISILLVPLKNSICDAERKGLVSVLDLNKLSSIISCIQGFLWGLASTINRVEAKNFNLKIKLFGGKCESISELNSCIDVFVDSFYFLSCMLFLDNGQLPENLDNVQSFPKSNHKSASSAAEESSLTAPAGESNILCRRQQFNSEISSRCSASFDIDNDTESSSVWRKMFQSDKGECAATLLAESDIFELRRVNIHFLLSLLKGENPEAAILLRQLFIASSAVLRLHLLIYSTPLLSRLVPTFLGFSQFLLLELSDMVDEPQPFSFVWLDGVLKFLEELGGHFPLTNPALSRTIYAKLIDLHLKAIGRCISLQGKRATLASHDMESSAKTLDGHIESHKSFLSQGLHFIDEFKTRLRMSFKEFIKKPSELHLLSAVQALERALVGVQEGSLMIYQINTGSAGGGKVSSFVAAGIDCLDLVLEFVSGRKRLNVVKRHIQSFISCLFNIVLHLHSPFIFYGKLEHKGGVTDPDSGSVILMCVEVLTRISGRHSLFEMDSYHVAHSLRVPAMLFRDFHQLRLSKAPATSNSLSSSDSQDCNILASENSCTVDRRFLIYLYAACCRLLYTVLKRHKSECEKCIALLEESVCVLLQSLEMEGTDSDVSKGDFVWQLPDGVTCASFLRRIYEEIRQQKDVFGRHSYKFLSSYIWIYSGYGPLQTGIKREIDEALKPGVHALIDACSKDDLQRIHTSFGEGPCRNRLATLQHDYKVNFQYEGKV